MGGGVGNEGERDLGLASSGVDRGGTKGQIKTVEMLARLTADRGSGESSEKLLGEKEKLIMSGSGANGRKRNPEHECRNWPEGR